MHVPARRSNARGMPSILLYNNQQETLYAPPYRGGNPWMMPGGFILYLLTEKLPGERIMISTEENQKVNVTRFERHFKRHCCILSRFSIPFYPSVNG